MGVAHSAEQNAGRLPREIRRVAHVSVVDAVVDEIRRSLLQGALVPGEPFSIVELSDRLGVSHIPVREALRRMEAEGLVELRPGRKARVPPLTVQDLTEIFHLRAVVEADVMARAVLLYDTQQLAAIETMWERLTVVPPADAEDIFDRHRSFHDLLVAQAIGSWERRMLSMLHRAADRYVALLVARDAAETSTNLPDLHRGLLKAAKSRSPERAKAAVHEHYWTAMDLISTLLTEGRPQ